MVDGIVMVLFVVLEKCFVILYDEFVFIVIVLVFDRFEELNIFFNLWEFFVRVVKGRMCKI